MCTAAAVVLSSYVKTFKANVPQLLWQCANVEHKRCRVFFSNTFLSQKFFRSNCFKNMFPDENIWFCAKKNFDLSSTLHAIFRAVRKARFFDTAQRWFFWLAPLTNGQPGCEKSYKQGYIREAYLWLEGNWR